MNQLVSPEPCLPLVCPRRQIRVQSGDRLKTAAPTQSIVECRRKEAVAFERAKGGGI